MTYRVRIDWAGDGSFTNVGDDVTARILPRSTIVAKYGRDQLRTLSPIAPGSAEFELDNRSRDYSPENTASPLAGNILPGRQLLIEKAHGGTDYTLFRGHLDDYDVLPDTDTRSVRLTATDMLEKFRTEITTDLHFGIRTGEAIGHILDAMGWPAADRDIDPGATTIRWYWEEQSDGLTALQRLVNSEGPGAFVMVGADGKFVFRDRHHRLLRAESTTSQATFRDKGAEPVLSRPLVYDHGWRDIVNAVALSVAERRPDPELSAVFTSDETLSIADGETVTLHAGSSDPFYGALVPTAETDYTVLSGAVTVTMSRASGQSTTLFIKATGGPAVLSHIQVRAYPVRTVRTVRIEAEDSTSIGRYGRRSYPGEVPWAGVHDAKAIADLILAQRAERLPLVRIRLVDKNATRLTQQLSRDLSDRITIVDSETGLNGDFYIERIEHRITWDGQHETVFGCEKVPIQPTSVFRFDVAGAGFNDGKFGATGLDDPNSIFLFDSASHGFNDGIFAT